MRNAFLPCLSATLFEETAYPQPVGGPYLRHANGSLAIPERPDGRFFDDDPDDTGGRTGCGILQREYDAFLKMRNMPKCDVWRITDADITEIYEKQYWDAIRADELPPGIDLMVFDMAVNCGVGMASRRLQRALGCRMIDGHVGHVTVMMAQSANLADLVCKLYQLRDQYYRQCRTFWKHGRGWSARNNRVANVALKMIGQSDKPAANEFAHVDLNRELPTSPKSLIVQKPPIDGMIKSSTGWSAVTLGGVGGSVVVSKIVDHASDVAIKVSDTAAAAATNAVVSAGESAVAATADIGGKVIAQLVVSPTLWVLIAAFAAIAGLSAYIWLERRRRLDADLIA